MKHILEVVKGDESGVKQKMGDESGNTQVICAKVHMNPEPEDEASPDVEKPNDDNEPDSAGVEEDQSIVEFKDQAYELSRAYELEEEYQEMMVEQEAAVVQALTPQEQAGYQELSRLHQ